MCGQKVYIPHNRKPDNSPGHRRGGCPIDPSFLWQCVETFHRLYFLGGKRCTIKGCLYRNSSLIYPHGYLLAVQLEQKKSRRKNHNNKNQKRGSRQHFSPKGREIKCVAHAGSLFHQHMGIMGIVVKTGNPELIFIHIDRTILRREDSLLTPADSVPKIKGNHQNQDGRTQGGNHGPQAIVLWKKQEKQVEKAAPYTLYIRTDHPAFRPAALVQAITGTVNLCILAVYLGRARNRRLIGNKKCSGKDQRNPASHPGKRGKLRKQKTPASGQATDTVIPGRNHHRETGMVCLSWDTLVSTITICRFPTSQPSRFLSAYSL